LNRSDVDVGSTLDDFKAFTLDFPPNIRGDMIGASEPIRIAHNSFARPEPFIFDEKKEKDDEDDDAFHFIGFVPVNGKLYELDGLKQGPIVLGECTMDNWLDKARPAIQERIEKYSTKEIRFNLLALCKNRTEVLTKELATLTARKTQLTSSPSNQETKQALTTVEDNIAQTKQAMQAEEAKFAAWKAENVRRRHNYVPFIYNLLKVLAEKNKLADLVEKASKITQEKLKKKIEAKKKEKEKEKEQKAEATKAK